MTNFLFYISIVILTTFCATMLALVCVGLVLHSDTYLSEAMAIAGIVELIAIVSACAIMGIAKLRDFDL